MTEPASGVPSPGRSLAEARAARGLTVTEVAHRLKFAPRQIEALEADRYDALAGPAFARGMARAYAKLLGIDAEAIVGALNERLPRARAANTPSPGLQVPFPRARRPGSFAYLIFSGVLIVGVAGVLVEWLLRPDSVTEVVPAPAAPAPVLAQATASVIDSPPPAEEAPAPAATAEPAPAPVAAERRIELVFERESWVEVRDAGGRVLLSRLNAPGSRQQLAGEAPFSIVIGNAGGVRLRYNDADVDLKPHTRTDVARLTLE
jgi:cytoskeleton protein RodZ